MERLDRARFEQIAALVYEPLQRYARRRTDPDTAADVVAESLTVLWRRLDDVPVGSEIAWSYGVARRCLANARRSARRGRALTERIGHHARTDSPPPGNGDADLWEALALLKPDDRELIRLWAWEQLTPGEIAVCLGISANAVSIRLHRAKAALAERLGSRKREAASGQESVVTDEKLRKEVGG